MKILVLGSGGREHALVRSLANSPNADQVWIAPGNGGTALEGRNVNLSPENFEDVAKFVSKEKVDFVVVGPEAPLVNGIVDFFKEDERTKNIPIFGPNKAAAQLEGSKDFAKRFMQRHSIPTAGYQTFSDDQFEAARDYLISQPLPIVLKADGLAAGKGVRVCLDRADSLNALEDILKDKKYGQAGAQVVIENFLDGIELSVFGICDGENYVLLPTAKDYKRRGEGDTGLNTGGMGAISPVPFASEELMTKVKKEIVEPTLKGLVIEGIHYTGFLYFGLMKVGDSAFVIEYNCRMGDPETEAVLPRIESDLLTVLHDAACHNLTTKSELRFSKESAATVVLVADGYPEGYKKGMDISGIEEVKESIVFHAGTKVENETLKSNGGRVLAITSLAPSLEQALEQSYQSADKISFDGKRLRKDIGYDCTTAIK